MQLSHCCHCCYHHCCLCHRHTVVTASITISVSVTVTLLSLLLSPLMSLPPSHCYYSFYYHCCPATVILLFLQLSPLLSLPPSHCCHCFYHHCCPVTVILLSLQLSPLLSLPPSRCCHCFYHHCCLYTCSQKVVTAVITIAVSAHAVPLLSLLQSPLLSLMHGCRHICPSPSANTNAILSQKCHHKITVIVILRYPILLLAVTETTKEARFQQSDIVPLICHRNR